MEKKIEETSDSGVKESGTETPVSKSVTRDQLERDLKMARHDLEDAQERISLIEKMLSMYFGYSPEIPAISHGRVIHEAKHPIIGRFADMRIADACARVLDDMGNEWLSLASLEKELRRRGKLCCKGSIEPAIKSKPDAFEIVKREKKNYYRRKILVC